MRVPRWVIGVVVLWICAISAVSGLGWRHQERINRELERQDSAIVEEAEAREAQSCEQTNKGRAELRRALSVVLTDALIGAARTPPDPAVIQAFRTGLVEAFDREFPGRNCDAEAEARARAADNATTTTTTRP